MMSIAIGVYEDPSLMSNDIITQYTDIQEQYAQDVAGETSAISPEDYQQEGSFGNAVRMGLKIVGLMIKGLNPFPFTQDTFSDSIATLVAMGLMLFRGFMYIILGMAIYDKIKNRKTD